MPELNKLHKSVLKRYNRPVVHMRHQVRTKRFGLVFGAGLSKDFGLPNWSELVSGLAKDQKIQGEDVLRDAAPRAGLPYQTEMLFEHYKQRRYTEISVDQHHTRSIDFSIAADWREIVQKHLYAKVAGDLGDSLDKHPYLNQYIPLIKNTHMTVTYNFDDFIEQSLFHKRSPEEESRSRGYESVTDPWTQFRRTTAIIYHPNGVVPQILLEIPSDRFVFSEASYAEQLMAIFAGDQAGLLNHFSKHTCLFVGMSLEDETLRSVLMQGARSCPGNFHYYIHYLKPDETLNNKTRQAITLTNFKVYNLITLFLRNEEIRVLGELINVDTCPSNQFCDFACEYGIPVQFRFYITGSLGVGKSTTINQFRSLYVLDEWLEQRPPVLAEDWEQLTGDAKTDADNWIIGQFRRKNDFLRDEKEGIFVINRGPLDPLSFTPDTELNSKASRILVELCPGKVLWKVENGRVILLQGDAKELELRMIITQRKGYTAEKLEKMEAKLGELYGSDGVISFDTRGLIPADVARRVAEVIHLEDYKPVCNLHERLEHIQNGGLDEAK